MKKYYVVWTDHDGDVVEKFDDEKESQERVLELLVEFEKVPTRGGSIIGVFRGSRLR